MIIDYCSGDIYAGNAVHEYLAADGERVQIHFEGRQIVEDIVRMVKEGQMGGTPVRVIVVLQLSAAVRPWSMCTRRFGATSGAAVF